MTPVDTPTTIDWNDLATALARYAAATTLCVSAYDDAGVRRTGPLATAKVAATLVEAGLLDDGGACLAIETDLALTCLRTGEPQKIDVGGDLTVQAIPVQLGSRVGAVIVFGWAFCRFPTSLGCQQIAKRLGIDGVKLWSEARLESPVSSERMAVFTNLLGTMVEAIVRHAIAIAGLVELSRLREVFLASVSHELRTPLQALSTRLEVLLRAPPTDPQVLRAAVLKLQQHVRTEGRLVEDLIEASSTRTGQFPIHKQSAALVDILDAAVSAVAPNAESKGVALHVNVAELGTSPDLFADPVRIQQVFWNLLSNAVKFTAGGGSIDVVATRRDDFHVVAVSDTGKGIDAEMLPRVFEPFAKQMRENEQGLGLGLAIAKHIVEAHGGTISVESSSATRGTTFRVTLPRKVAAS